MNQRAFFGTVAAASLCGGLSFAAPGGQSPSPEPKPVAAGATPAPASGKLKVAGGAVADAGFVMIGHLEQCSRTITVKTGPKGTVYHVTDRDGRVLADHLTLDELKAAAPDVHEFLKTATAAGKASGQAAGCVIDARVAPSAVR